MGIRSNLAVTKVAQTSLLNEEVDEGSPGGEDGSLDAALAEKLLSERTLQDEPLHPLRIFGRLQRHRHCPAGLVVYLRGRGDNETEKVTDRLHQMFPI